MRAGASGLRLRPIDANLVFLQQSLEKLPIPLDAPRVVPLATHLWPHLVERGHTSFRALFNKDEMGAEFRDHVGIASVTATCIGRTFFGIFPSFNVPAIALVEGRPGNRASLVPCFGVLMGCVAWLTTRGIYWFEDLFDRMPGNYYTRHTSGMLLVGLMMYGFMSFSASSFGQPNHYYVQGVGYATIMDILNGGLTAAGFLLLLGVAKLLATCLTLGSGASGGVFSPCMFIGAAVGAGCSSALASGSSSCSQSNSRNEPIQKINRLSR